ncbi:hypothetical protein BHE74_00043100 [Ensete ventricosum]|nr:hypothetical protein GW17_00058799 [Ensete ventricosum]RWW50631.1 hypothetical protein BHE74_00043100 [Ensete ventricosum]RZR80959.1 hypothetical protein BHM03_00007087 [Ensete ventricosum]
MPHNSFIDCGLALIVSVSSLGVDGPFPLAARDSDLSRPSPPRWDLCRLETLAFFLRPVNSSAGRLLGTPDVPLVLSTEAPLLTSSVGISYMSGGKAGSAGCSGVGALTGIEEACIGCHPPTLSKPHIKLILTIFAKPTMSHDDHITKRKNKVSKRTLKS